MVNAISRATRQAVVLATLLAVTAFASSVHAAAFRTRWDPIFNTDFSSAVGIFDVGWRGTALISVDDPCVAPGLVTFANPCGTATLESYLLEFYDTSNGDAPLGESSGSAPLPMVTEVNFDGSSVADGFSIDGTINAGSFFFGDSFSYTAYLDFDVTEGPQLEMRANCEAEFCVSYFNDAETYPATITWSQVPVPAPISLMVAGIAVMVLSRRKRAGE